MPYSVATFTGDGSNTQFSVPFPLIDRSHLLVFVGGVPTSFSWVADGVINITPAPGNGIEVELRRDSNRAAPLVDFHDGAVLTEADLELANKQAIFVAQEALDSADESIMSPQIEAWSLAAQSAASSAGSSAINAAASASAAAGSASAAAASALDAANSASLAGTKVDKLVANTTGAAFRLTTDANVTFDLESSTLAASYVHAPAAAVSGVSSKKYVVDFKKFTVEGVNAAYFAGNRVEITKGSGSGVFDVAAFDAVIKPTSAAGSVGDLFGYRVTFQGDGAGSANRITALSLNLTNAIQANSAYGIDIEHMGGGAVTLSSALRVRGGGTTPVVSQALQVDETVDLQGALVRWNQSAGSFGDILQVNDSSFANVLSINSGGDVNFGKTQRRIKAPMSDGTTPSNNLLFQTTAVNEATRFGIMPSGSGVTAGYYAFGGSDVNNTHVGVFGVNASEVFLLSGKFGSGVVKDLVFYRDGAEKFRLGSNGPTPQGPALADNFAGADIGARVNAAFAAGHSSVYVKATGTILTAITVGQNQKLIFAPGAWTLSVVGSAAITLAGHGASVEGAGQGTVLTTSVNNQSIISVNTGYNKIHIRDLVLDRSITAVAGGNGISFGITGWGSNGIIENVVATNHYIGILCGPTSYSFINGCFSAYNVSHGFHFSGTSDTNGLQWYIRDNLSQQNGGNGFFIQSVSGPSTASVGDITSCRTYANTGKGIYALAAGGSYAIQSLRIRDCFLGNDGSSEIHLDTYGTNHDLNNNYIELGGTSATGPTLATAASNLSHGIHITANNGHVSITGGSILYQSLCGIHTQQTGALIVTGTRIIDCGAANTGGAGSQSGIFINATGQARIVGVVSKKAAAITQLYGIYCFTDNNTIIGCELDGQTAPLAGTTLVNTQQIGNRPMIGTGWGAPTGTPTRTTFATGSVTLPQLAERVKALIDDLTTQRIIGA